VSKRVIIIASGETERRALPHLLRHLSADGISIDPPIRTPPRFGKITGDSAFRLIISAWHERKWSAPPDKFIVLTDADGKDPQVVLGTLEQELARTSIQELPVPVLLAAAKWHLEAWFFADAGALRKYLGGKSLGAVDPSKPDEIQNPKLCLRHLLSEPYSSRISEEIAQGVSPLEVRTRSPSFARFEQAVRNGSAEADVRLTR
jgi:hypothetical protein